MDLEELKNASLEELIEELKKIRDSKDISDEIRLLIKEALNRDCQLKEFQKVLDESNRILKINKED